MRGKSLDSGLHSLPVFEAVATLLHRNLQLFYFFLLLNKNSFAPTVIKHKFLTFKNYTKILFQTQDSNSNIMGNCTLLGFNHIGLFGFKEEPKLLLLMYYPSTASASQAKAFSMQLKKQNKTNKKKPKPNQKKADHFPC